ncbi:hypothetical protein GLOIN_2v31980 [Rhizophagus irregularis DAOM 181602=DAOM 197198]|uniref:Uncharacterized protein n=1 Tax=Rhizophagus irregularis (strain DAOM 181602 / DAOM 197198 / MUCL 43194) TaxID=747089 RepID=A0A2P4Q2N7_RHIID|nr:hypothetical protein GLOIN_2v31980 [Rhizophagus irregularis DAOM 181602=DAOM 197198]POG71917.1 hypothetical protein GLOIN_2v31980 [Rhizophagus irregularis DAOM 181602=DAOM 197198]|eukprot:XP_025178783.1 hypothetical protein GLOIN_2v31980 [Rhizophagus irregularis DAOM 181602=DAOM 197198]
MESLFLITVIIKYHYTIYLNHYYLLSVTFLLKICQLFLKKIFLITMSLKILM